MAGLDDVNVAIDRVSASSGRRDAALASAEAHAADAAELRRRADDAEAGAAKAWEAAERAGADLDEAHAQIAALGVPREAVDAFVAMRRSILASVAAVPGVVAAPPGAGETLAEPRAPGGPGPGDTEGAARGTPGEASPGDGRPVERAAHAEAESDPGGEPPAPVSDGVEAPGPEPMDGMATTQAKPPRKRVRSRVGHHAAQAPGPDAAAEPPSPSGASIDGGPASGTLPSDAGEPLLPGLAGVGDPSAGASATLAPDVEGGREPLAASPDDAGAAVGRPHDWYDARNRPDPEDDEDGHGRFDDVPPAGEVDAAGGGGPEGRPGDPAGDDGSVSPPVTESAASDVTPDAAPPLAVPATPVDDVVPGAVGTAASAPRAAGTVGRPGRMGMGGGLPPAVAPSGAPIPDYLRDPAAQVDEEDPIPF